MSDVLSASANTIELLDGAVCHFMGSGVVAITSIDDEGRPQTGTMGNDVMSAAVHAYKTDTKDGTVGSWSYRFPAEGVVAFFNSDEPDSSVVVTVGDLENALAGMAN